MFDPDVINLPAKCHLPFWWHQEDDESEELNGQPDNAVAGPSSAASGLQELEHDHYDVIVLGTGVAESIAAA
jgi:hypothetical protein